MTWRRRRTLRGKRVLVTGASSGIGRELACQLADEGARVLVTARREERLATLCRELELKGAELTYVAGDITSATLQKQIVETSIERFGGIDILINNAGAGAVGPFELADEERLRRVTELNYIAPVEMIRHCLPTLKSGNDALIVNIGSVLGHVSMPLKSEYCAAKFALRGFSEALRSELKSTGIELLWVAPNTTRSEFFERLLDKQGKVATNPLSMSPEQVARRTIRAIKRRRDDLILTLSGRWLIRLDFIWPELLRWIQQRTLRR